MKVKYFLRGIGVGILVTTIILFAGTRKYTQGKLTDAQIMKRAKELGMITKEQFNDYKMDQSLENVKESMNEQSSPEPTINSPSKTSSKKETSSESNTKPNNESKTNHKKTARETVTITIESGMVSQSVARYLYQKNVIGSIKDFNQYMSEHGVTQKLRAGEFEIPIDASYEEIVEIIT